MATQPEYEALGFSNIKVSRDGVVVVISIDRPKQRNTFTSVLGDEIAQTMRLADKDERVRVVILTADHNAPAFCSGADMSASWSSLPGVDELPEHAFRDPGGQLTLAILQCRKITISAVNGHAVGVGATALQLPFDFRFVWSGAKIGFPFVRRAIVPEGKFSLARMRASSYLLPRLVGQSAATALFLSGQVYSPTHPLLERLYFSTLPQRDQVLPSALAFAKELGANTSAPSVAATKALLNHPTASPEEGHLAESYLLKKLTRGEGKDSIEGMKAFKAGRAPEFKDTLEIMKHWAPWWRNLDVTVGTPKL